MFFMENPPRQILDDIASLIVSVRSQLSLLEEKLTELSAYTDQNEKSADPEDVTDVTPMESSSRIDAGDLLKEAEHLVYETGYADNTVYVAETLSDNREPDAEPVPEQAPEPVQESGPDSEAESETDSGPEPEPESEPEHDQKPDCGPEAAPQMKLKPVQSQAPSEHLAVMDVLAEKEAWKKDRPGMPVKDVRSAISLNDRALFIRSLFREDPLLFSQTLARINAMDSLEEAENALRKEFPEWNMEAEVVYRFMMCVRRKVG